MEVYALLLPHSRSPVIPEIHLYTRVEPRFLLCHPGDTLSLASLVHLALVDSRAYAHRSSRSIINTEGILTGDHPQGTVERQQTGEPRLCWRGLLAYHHSFSLSVGDVNKVRQRWPTRLKQTLVSSVETPPPGSSSYVCCVHKNPHRYGSWRL